MSGLDATETYFKGKKVLITGAGGFIGRPLTRAFVSLGAVVTGLGRGSEAFDRNEVNWINGSFSDADTLARACEGQDFVYHLLNSSTPASATQHPIGDVLSNVVPSIQLLEACVKAGVKRFIFFSSGGTVYGQGSANPMDEFSATEPRSAYGVSKLSIEKYCRIISDNGGMEYRIIRISNPYGPGQSPFRKQGIIATAMHAALTGNSFSLWGDGKAIRDFVYIEDVVSSAIRIGLCNTSNRIYNVGSGVGRSINSVLNDITAIVSENRLEVTRLPSRSVDVVTNILDISLIQQLGWQPMVPWQLGLLKTKSSFKDQYIL